MVGVEVERRIRQHSDQWLRMLYGSLSMNEVEEVLIDPDVIEQIEPEPEPLEDSE